MALVRSPKKEQKEEGEERWGERERRWEEGGRGRAGREVQRLSLWQSFFFFLPPLFLCKKCTQAWQPILQRSAVFPGGWGGRGGDPQAWHPSLLLKVASYCLETNLSLNTRLKIELGGPPALLPNHCQNEQLQ